MHTSRSNFLLAGLFVFAGIMHFVIPSGYAAIMPPWVPYAAALVYLTGVFEIAGGIGLLIPPVRKLAAVLLIALLIAVFPANVQMLMNAFSTDESTLRISLLWLRLPLQPLLIVWVFRTAISQPSRRAA